MKRTVLASLMLSLAVALGTPALVSCSDELYEDIVGQWVYEESGGDCAHILKFNGDGTGTATLTRRSSSYSSSYESESESFSYTFREDSDNNRYLTIVLSDSNEKYGESQVTLTVEKLVWRNRTYTKY